MSEQSTDADLASIVDRILRSRSEEDDAKAATKDIYAEAVARGYDKTAIGRVVARLRKVEQGKDVDAADEQFDLYLTAYNRGKASHTHARERAA